ncbi:MAG: DNA-binding protein WhiA [Bacilli bacterium]|nr:DNA-binding protein WhiA [Bacilli bacterium]
MSFATEVKKELLGLDLTPCCKKALIAGILHGIGEVAIVDRKFKLKVSSFMPSVIRYIAPFIRNEYGLQTQTSYLERTNINKKRIYCLEILDDPTDLLDELHLLPFDAIVYDDDLVDSECCKRAYVIGSFIAKGSINDPRKSDYHLEILFRKAESVILVKEILFNNGIEAKVINKNNQYLLYIKKSETISNFLAYVGANSGVLQFEDLRIMRDLNNAVNRMMNCDISNGKKSLNCCNEQLEAIKFLKEHELDKKLTIRLQDAMKLREEYPDATLSELSDFSENILGKHLSKSGISHCFKEIMNYYKLVLKKGNN